MVFQIPDTKKTRDKKGKFVTKKPMTVSEKKVDSKVVSTKDQRLDRLMPLMVKVITRLLGTAGMMRYRTDFIEKVREVMSEEETKK